MIDREFMAKLKQLDAIWEESRASVVEALNPPATSEQLQWAQETMGFEFVSEVVTWFSWHNGMHKEEMFGAFDFPAASLDLAVENWQVMWPIEEQLREQDPEWEPGKTIFFGQYWVPIFHQDDLLICVDCDPQAEPQGRIVYTYKGHTHPDVTQAESLTYLVDTWLAAYDNGVYEYKPRNRRWQRVDVTGDNADIIILRAKGLM